MTFDQHNALAVAVGLAVVVSAAALYSSVEKYRDLQSSEASMQELRAWTTKSPRIQSLADDHRLIGFACGLDRLTMTAEEEDNFPAYGCEAIEAIADVCPPDPDFPILEDEPVTAVECAAYWGDGW